MSEVRIRENESLESALKRFKRQCARSKKKGFFFFVQIHFNDRFFML